MQPDFDKADWRIGDPSVLEKLCGSRALPPFSPRILDFLNDVASELFRTAKSDPDVITFAFWCRRAALEQRKKQYSSLENRLGRGVVFHSTPANVPVNFAFSFAAGLLAGNANIVRLPARDFPQTEKICAALRHALSLHPEMADRVVMMRYASDRALSDFFSSVCDTRIVWGGDQSISHMRQSPLPPRANEITFADRYSILLIRSDRYLDLSDKKQTARDFYNDTYLSGQSACTAPHLLVWLGPRTAEARDVFWREAYAVVREKYDPSPIDAVLKQAAFQRFAAESDGFRIPMPDNRIVRIEVPGLAETLMEYRFRNGFFFEYEAGCLDEILPVCGRKCQTVTQIGLKKDEFETFLKNNAPAGIDRVVGIGHAMDFSLIWDGIDLIRTLSRVVSIL